MTHDEFVYKIADRMEQTVSELVIRMVCFAVAEQLAAMTFTGIMHNQVGGSEWIDGIPDDRWGQTRYHSWLHSLAKSPLVSEDHAEKIRKIADDREVYC